MSAEAEGYFSSASGGVDLVVTTSHVHTHDVPFVNVTVRRNACLLAVSTLRASGTLTVEAGGVLTAGIGTWAWRWLRLRCWWRRTTEWTRR